MSEFSSIPPAWRQSAANFANWFPEVLAILGAPDLEEQFLQGRVQVNESSAGKTLEVVLPKKGQHSEAQLGSVKDQLDRLDELASDFEQLAGQLQSLNAASLRGEIRPGLPAAEACGAASSSGSMEARLDAATEQLLQLADMMKACPPASCSDEGVANEKPPLLKPAEVLQAIRSIPKSPRSARGRGGQAQQGGEQRNLGAGRSRANKAAEWKTQLKIEVTKVREMPEGDPKSPKGKAPAQVWGASKAHAAASRCGDTPASMQARIEQKFTKMLGSPQPSRRSLARCQTLPASAFDRSNIAELAKKIPATTEDV
ncbi:unnamed protein product [Effrenium voratum]|nr:unnamed protein product [Effrenium voratum]